MYSFLLFLFVVVAFVLIIVVLMQPDKSGLSGSSMFSQGGGSSAFGGRETINFLHKATIYLAIIFFILAIFIGLLSKSEFSGEKVVSNSKSIIAEKSKQQQQKKVELPNVGNGTETALPAVDGANQVESALPSVDTKATETTPITPAAPVVPSTKENKDANTKNSNK